MKKIVLLLISIFALIFLIGCTSNGSTGTVTLKENPSNNGTISIPLEKISTQAKWYEYESNGANIRFFAVKGSDGSVKTAFDMCDVCYYTKKGYRQEGTNMVCNNCGNKYPIDGLGTKNRNPGGCWPSYLPNKTVGNNLIVAKSDLDAQRGKFL